MLISTLPRCAPLAQLLEGMSPSREGNHVTLLFLPLPGLAQRVKHVLQHGEPRQSGAGRARPWLTAARPCALALLRHPVSVMATRPCEALVWHANAHRRDLIQTARTEKTPPSTAGSTCAQGRREGGGDSTARVHGLRVPESLRQHHPRNPAGSPRAGLPPDTTPKPTVGNSSCVFISFYQMTRKTLAF